MTLIIAIVLAVIITLSALAGIDYDRSGWQWHSIVPHVLGIIALVIFLGWHLKQLGLVP